MIQLYRIGAKKSILLGRNENIQGKYSKKSILLGRNENIQGKYSIDQWICFIIR